MARARPPVAVPLWLDCSSGASAGSLLGALIEVGAPARTARDAVAALDVEGLRLRLSRVDRGGVRARAVGLGALRRAAGLRTARGRVRRALSGAAAASAERALALLFGAEARVRGVPVERVRLDAESGAEAIAGCVAVCAALDRLGPVELTASPLPLAPGAAHAADGEAPPALPAALELLTGVPTRPAAGGGEPVTPAAAAILVTSAARFGAMPPLVLRAYGHGTTARETGVVRALLGQAAADLETDVVSIIETHLDDMNPEHVPFLVESLLEAGALDVSLSPLAMKKGRAGQLLRVIATPAEQEALARRVLLESTALGVRIQQSPRLKLPRESRRVATRFGPIAVKLARKPDGRVVVAPEFDDCARAARRHGTALSAVYREAERAAEDAFA